MSSVDDYLLPLPSDHLFHLAADTAASTDEAGNVSFVNTRTYERVDQLSPDEFIALMDHVRAWDEED